MFERIRPGLPGNFVENVMQLAGMPFRMAWYKLQPFPACEICKLREFEIGTGKREIFVKIKTGAYFSKMPLRV